MNRLLVIVMALSLVGCGAARNHESDWEAQISPAWTQFEHAYEGGWTRGCEAANDQVLKTDPEMPLAALPTCTPAAGAGDSPDVPFKEPADPEAAGSKLGYQDGCTTAFELNDKPLGNICFNR